MHSRVAVARRVKCMENPATGHDEKSIKVTREKTNVRIHHDSLTNTNYTRTRLLDDRAACRER